MLNIILLALLMFGSQAYAANCIVDKEENVVSKINYEPNIADLEKRGESVFKCDDSIKIGDADFRNNKVVKHVKTKKETDAQAEEAAKIAAHEASHASAVTKLEALGLSAEEAHAVIEGGK